MKLTPELLSRSSSSINTLKDRSLDLRGLKIPAIENLGVTHDQNDSIDFTDNDIRYLGNFPLLSQLKHLQLGNNLISRIDSRLGYSLPALHSLDLTNNSISDLAEVGHLSRCTRLEYLCLMGNPVSREKNYRDFVIWKLPQVRVLDYQRIRDKERALAKELMETEEGRPTELAASILKDSEASAMDVDDVGKKKTFEPGRLNGSSRRLLSAEERRAIEDAIEKSESLDEIRRLEEQLKMGHTFAGSS
ncbi:Leucine-rich repeat [Kalmanozyma brasiliensis GHG001]|uniref:U2 small nuclear ribonucleoprotein A' n=1 Tax=Kalmanozyma brasiliensis (strain GHG001) TaxID=1365824 RepID=V5F0V1_KALBG|nr:Leucine-rich repeat [Kalmanozyma brasiliensis GHG001]EST08889.1 Leucine-rich repeat [Kalmanozyma brasiliensis GHG001]